MRGPKIHYESHRAPKKVIQVFIPSWFPQQTWRNGRVAVPPVQFDFQNKMATVTTAARSRETSAWAYPRDTNVLADTHLVHTGCNEAFNLQCFIWSTWWKSNLTIVLSVYEHKMNGSFFHFTLRETSEESVIALHGHFWIHHEFNVYYGLNFRLLLTLHFNLCFVESLRFIEVQEQLI